MKTNLLVVTTLMSCLLCSCAPDREVAWTRTSPLRSHVTLTNPDGTTRTWVAKGYVSGRANHYDYEFVEEATGAEFRIAANQNVVIEVKPEDMIIRRFNRYGRELP